MAPHAVVFALGAVLLPAAAHSVGCFLMPIQELSHGYRMLGSFVGQEKLDTLAKRLLVVTVASQVALGYLGIAFIRRGQERKNALISIGDGRMNFNDFARLVGRYMLVTALPYMLQRTIMENVNSYAYGNFARAVEQEIRISSLFPSRPNGMVDTNLAAVQGSNYTVEAYTDAFNSIVNVWYSTIESKLFALPKLMLVPGMLIKQPKLVLAVLPASLVLDVGRASLISSLNKRTEMMQRHIQELASRRQKMEQHDTKSEEIIRRGAAAEFVQRKWRGLAKEMRVSTLKLSALTQFRGFINALFLQDILGPGIELVLAALLDKGDIYANDIWVYTRVVEDTIGFLLTRFRMDATLASLQTNMDRLKDLQLRLQSVNDGERPNCKLVHGSETLHVKGLRFKRGPSHSIKIENLELSRGKVYAVTGANGSGKSTFFGLLASCGERATKLPEGLQIEELRSLVMPTKDIVEVTQKLYCPFATKPLAWMLRRQLEDMSETEVNDAEARVVSLLREFAFHSGEGRLGAEPSDLELTKVHNDWYGALSGGQKIKAELVQKIFLQDECPGLLLIDEAFAPLDPASKMAVQRKLKEFCSRSLVLVIYHSDADTCVQGGFFDEVLHFSDGIASLAKTC